MAQAEQLGTVSTDSLVEELKRRIAQAEEAKSLLVTLANETIQPAKNPKVSAAKSEYWRRRREWLASNPGKTMEDFHRETRRVLTFDTSAHDRLVKLGESANPLYNSIRNQFFFRLAGSAFEEMVSVPDAADRLAQLDGCRRLTQNRWWDCLYPPGEVLRLFIAAHAADPINFQWRNVDVRSGGLAYELRTGELTADDALAVLQKSEQYAAQADYRQSWQRVRAALEPIFRQQKLPRPKTFAEAYRNHSGSLLPALGKGLYDAGLRATSALRGESATPDTDPSQIQHFLENCPPFRAMLCGVMLSWFNTSLKHKSGERFAAGRDDMFMAVYLPLCDLFVTRDRDQHKCFAELAQYADVGTEVSYFDEFAADL
jgi:hypothetical protein